MPEISISPSGKWLLITVHCSRPACDDELYLRDQMSGEIVSLSGPQRARYTATFDAEEGVLLCTNRDAPRGRLVVVDPNHPETHNWRSVVDEHPNWVMMTARAAGKRLWVSWLDGATSHVTLHSPDGRMVASVRWPEPGTVESIIARGEEFYGVYQSFSLPPRVYVVPAEGLSPRVLTSSVRHDVQVSVHVSSLSAPSTGGVRVPFFLLKATRTRTCTSLQGVDVDGAVLLTGYGGMHVPSTPRYSPSLLVWCDAGGQGVVANLRGGCELGEGWHQDGRRDRKENVFLDFEAVARFLIDSGRADRQRVAIHGRSNGGLLVGDAVVRNPDLFAAAACGVPLLDMLRYHLFLIADIWTEEYGHPEDPVACEWLSRYSPYHRVEAGLRYPPVLFYTSANDSRVHPMHARKMAARMQQEARGGPFLFRVEDEAGHGAGKPVGKMVTEEADILSFLLAHVGR